MKNLIYNELNFIFENPEYFLIIHANDEKNYYVQFIFKPESSELYAEAVSNRFLREKFRLDEIQISMLKIQGWQMPIPISIDNFHRIWILKNASELFAISSEIESTLRLVYKANDEDIKFKRSML